MLRNSIIGKRDEFNCAALHLGGVDFYCALGEVAEPGHLKTANENIWSKFPTASLPALIRVVQEEFGRDEFGLEDILPDGRLAICEMIFGDLMEGFTDEFGRLFEEYNRVVEMLQASGFEPPPQFRQLTEFTLGRRFEREIARQQHPGDPVAYSGALEVANLASKGAYQIDKTRANEIFSKMINDVVGKAVERPSRVPANAALELIALSKRLELAPNLDPAQERIYEALAAGTRNSGQLARLAGAVGLAHSAVRRPKISPHTAPHSRADEKDGGHSRRRHPRPDPS